MLVVHESWAPCVCCVSEMLPLLSPHQISMGIAVVKVYFQEHCGDPLLVSHVVLHLMDK